MTTSRTACSSAGDRRWGQAFAGLAAALAMALFGLAAQAAPAKDSLSAEDRACLECHARPGGEKTLGDGRKLSLQVAGKPFAQSVHGSEGCAACHSGWKTATTSRAGRSPAAARSPSS